MRIRGEAMNEQKGLTEKEKQEKLKEIDQLIKEKMEEGHLDSFTGKNKVWKIITYISLALALVLMISYSIQTVLRSENILTQLTNIIGTFILCIFTIFFLFTSLFADNKKGRLFIIIASLLLSIYSGFNLLVGANIISFKGQKEVIDLTNMDIKEVISWAKDNEISIDQIYENSDTIEQYKVIKQDIKEKTPLKSIKKITVTVSDGPNPNKDTVIPNMVGWDVDKAIKYIEKNHLLNVEIDFDFHEEVKRNIIYSQNIESTIRRSEPLRLKASLGKKDEFQYVTMINLVGMDEFHATTWLKRNHIDYDIEYGYSDTYDQGLVIKQKDKKGKVMDVTKNTKTVITLARNNKITIPDFNNMTKTEITTWATDNKLKLNLVEQYDEKIKKEKLIESSRIKGDTIEVGESIKIILSKGQIYMPKFTNVDDFRKWADENEIAYNINYEFNTSIQSGKLIYSSHQENELIKNQDTINLIISQGGTTTVPNFSGMTKKEIESACKKANLLCEYQYESNSHIEKDKIIKQSMRSESTVPEKTTITITLSSGK